MLTHKEIESIIRSVDADGPVFLLEDYGGRGVRITIDVDKWTISSEAKKLYAD